jgi:murein DD-endopeptidase MepM/ murein hydrolase activator NlpD
MNKKIWDMFTFLIILSSVLLIFFTYLGVDAFQPEVFPSEINPGDVFVLRIMDVETPRLPVAFFNDSPLYFSSCGEGCFVTIGAVEIEAKSGVHTIQVIVGDRKKDLNLNVVPATFPEISLTLPEEKVFLSPEDLKRAEMEEERLESIWQIISDRLWEGGFTLPLENDISTSFGTKRIINQKKISVHRGIDIRGKEGESVKASNKGKVILTEELFFGGNTVILDHGQGIFTIYMHLSKFNVKTGDIVSKGDIIGYVGSSGRASGPHLHFGVKVQNISANPVSLMGLAL